MRYFHTILIFAFIALFGAASSVTLSATPSDIIFESPEVDDFVPPKTDTELLPAPNPNISEPNPKPEQEYAMPEVINKDSLKQEIPANSAVPTVPFYSQFADISDPRWQKVGCGIAGTAMLIDFYSDGSVSVDELLDEGIRSGAFLTDAGWTHQGLINLTKPYGLDGESHSLAKLSMDEAFRELEQALEAGPVMASIYYTFTPGNPIPHLVVLNGIKDGFVYYNDPAEARGGGTISVEKFKPAWKKRYIEIRPTT